MELNDPNNLNESIDPNTSNEIIDPNTSNEIIDPNTSNESIDPNSTYPNDASDPTMTMVHTNYTNIILIDCNIKNYQTIVSSCNNNTLPIVYCHNTTRNEISNQITIQISNQTMAINRIAICSDSATTLFLENQPFFDISNNVDFIVELIKQYDISYIDYLACDTLNNLKWVNYYQLLMSQTNVIVGASNNATGNIQYGGDWIMENTCQNIENIYFTQNIEYYQYLLGNNFYNNTTDITTNFSSITQLSSFPTFNGTANFSTKYRIKTGGVDVDLALLYALNSVPTAGTYTTGMYGYSNGTRYDLSYFFAPIPPLYTSSTITFTGATILTNTTSNNSGLGVNTNTTYRSDNQASATTTGTLYKFIASGSFSMNAGSGATKCCAVIIGPGGYGMRRVGGAAGSGGCGILATFTLLNGVTYNITINAGTNQVSNGTTVAGRAAIISNEGSPTVSLTAMGALGPYNSGGTTSTGGTSIIGGSNTAIYISKNGSSPNPTGVDGYTFTNTEVTPNINSTSFSDMSTTIGSNNQASFSNYAIPTGYTSFGFGSTGGLNSGNGGGGGIYNKGGTTPGTSPNVTGNNGGNGIGYGNGGGITASTATTGGTGGPGVVYIYFNNKL